LIGMIACIMWLQSGLNFLMNFNTSAISKDIFWIFLL
jgi:hypothetical protein